MCARSLETNETRSIKAANHGDTDEADVHDIRGCFKLTTSECDGATGKKKSGDLTFRRTKTAWPSANWLFWRGRGRLVAQADLLTPSKAHADLSAWPAKISLVEKVK
jgi:hypothetical protein